MEDVTVKEILIQVNYFLENKTIIHNRIKLTVLFQVVPFSIGNIKIFKKANDRNH